MYRGKDIEVCKWRRGWSWSLILPGSFKGRGGVTGVWGGGGGCMKRVFLAY